MEGREGGWREDGGRMERRLRIEGGRREGYTRQL
jgi:hypothetical protein